jgi:hypothetical protein
MRVRFAVVLAGLMLAGANALAQECPPDEVQVTVDGNTAVVHHLNALFNCCPTMDYEIQLDGWEIDIFEHEILAECYCVCCFDLSHELRDLIPGTYTVRVWGAYGCENEPCAAAQFTVVEGSGDLMWLTRMSDCGGWPTFEDGFESGTTGEWSQTLTGSGRLSVQRTR